MSTRHIAACRKLPGRSGHRLVAGFIATFIILPLAVSLTGCRPAKPVEAPSTPRVEAVNYGPVRVEFTIDPPKVRLDRDLVLSIKVSSPSEIDVNLPNLGDRLEGFQINGAIDVAPVAAAGATIVQRRLLLTPVLAEEYRLAPIPITYQDRSKSPPEPGWFATRPIVLEVVTPTRQTGKTGILGDLELVWIPPSPATIALWVLLLVLGAVAVVFLSKLTRRVHRQIQLMRMSPRDRALFELAELMAKDLVTKNLVKDFYLELTMIVRRYIERSHNVRAPEQTTEEFLVAVSRDPRFGADVVTRLKDFLQAADLVKFAAYQPGTVDIERASSTARGYIESDASHSTPTPTPATPTGGP